jgi:hypothetical protein
MTRATSAPTKPESFEASSETRAASRSRANAAASLNTLHDLLEAGAQSNATEAVDSRFFETLRNRVKNSTTTRNEYRNTPQGKESTGL